MNITPLLERFRLDFAELERKLSDPEVFQDREQYSELAREHQRLKRILDQDDRRARLRMELADSTALLEEEEDPEFCELASRDIEQLTEEISQLDRQILLDLLPPREEDKRNAIIEIRPAAGGSESSLFAADLWRMYSRFAEQKGWKQEILSRSDTDLGGIREICFMLQGQDVHRFMRFERGVHRVQRIPVTETGGRIHTSTVTVAVLQEAKEVDIEIRSEDLRMDVFRSSGPGGQHVNTTDSAVRITHIPSGVSVSSQQEKSQHRNREIAMRILRARLLEEAQLAEQAQYAEERRTQVGSGDRSERIRTYNFPQNRVTDHRFGLSWHNLPAMLEGDLNLMFEQILAEDVRQRLEAELQREQ